MATLMSLSLGGEASAQAQPSAQQKPNIVMIISDDTGYGDLGPYGGAARRTD